MFAYRKRPLYMGSILLCKIIRFNLKKKLLQLEYRFVSYIREELRIMEICNFCKKQFIIKTIMTIINLKSRDIENELHLSKSIVSRHITGKMNRPEIDIYIVERLLGIKIKDYEIKDEF